MKQHSQTEGQQEMLKLTKLVAALALTFGTFATFAPAVSAQEGPPICVAGENQCHEEHHDRGDIVEVQATCNADGTQSVTWLITNTSDDHPATIEELSATIGPITGAAIGDVLAPGASEHATVTTSGSQTGTVSLHVVLDYDGYKDRRDSDDAVFVGGCTAPTPHVVVVGGSVTCNDVTGDNTVTFVIQNNSTSASTITALSNTLGLGMSGAGVGTVIAANGSVGVTLITHNDTGSVTLNASLNNEVSGSATVALNDCFEPPPVTIIVPVPVPFVPQAPPAQVITVPARFTG